jgi:lysophospholipase-2
MQNTEKTHVVDPISDHTHTVIFLHGRDSTAVEFAEELFESQASDDRTLSQLFPNFKWVFPYSGLRNSTRFEMELSQWFDIWSVEEPEERKEIQLAGLKESIMFILDIIDREATIVPPKQIILGGISQGCATAIHALMQCDVQLNGFIGFCGWLPFRNEIEAIIAEATNANPLQKIQSLFNSEYGNSYTPVSRQLYRKSASPLATPVFLSHAIDDCLVPISNGEKLYQELNLLGMPVTWKAYRDGGHWINEPQGVDDMVAFLQNITTFKYKSLQFET